MPQTAVTESAATDAAGSRQSAATLLSRVRKLELFLQQPATRLTTKSIALTTVLWLVGTAVAIWRTRGVGALNSIWAEDGQNFLHDALTKSPGEAIATSFNGYWHLLPRLLAEIAVLFPIEWMPAALSIQAALITTGLAILVYVISGAYLPHPALRLLAALPLAFAPAGIGWVENNVATLQFPLLYALFWTLLWVPSSRVGRILAPLIVVVVAFTSALAVLFVPLAILRIVMRPRPLSWVVLGGLVAGAAVQFGAAALGYASRDGLGTPRYGDPIWAAWEYMSRVAPTAMLGEKWTFDGSTEALCPQFIVVHHNEHRLLVLGSLAIFAGLVVAAFRTGRPQWSLATLAAGYSVLLYSISIMALGCSAQRYLTAPALLLVASAAALLRPRDGALSKPAVVYLTLAAIVLVVNLRTDGPRAAGPRWSDVLNGARVQCADPAVKEVEVYTRWSVVLPCGAVRR